MAQQIPSMKIHSVYAREILDSRATPTIETMVVLESGYRGVASVPAGASIGSHEAHELRDGDEKRYFGKGVLNAVNNVNTVIAKALIGMDANNQSAVDKKMLELDGTPNKQKLGANAILSVSEAVAVAAAAAYRTPLYRYLNAVFATICPTVITRVPAPTFNLINGGKHGAGNLDFQEFHVVAATNKTFSEALRMGCEIYHNTKKILSYRNAIHSVGDEGGFAPDLFTNLDAIEILTEAIHQSPYRMGVEIFMGLDLAAGTFMKDRAYAIKDRPQPYSPKDFITYLLDLNKKYPMLILEDAIEEDDWEHWRELTNLIGENVLVVGDDLLATNPERLRKAIDEKACSAILLKPNQIGSVTEFLQVTALAKQNDIKTIVSHRSGETNDTFIADLAIGVQSDYVKFGAPARGERVAKYNRLLQIEREIIKPAA